MSVLNARPDARASSPPPVEERLAEKLEDEVEDADESSTFTSVQLGAVATVLCSLLVALLWRPCCRRCQPHGRKNRFMDEDKMGMLSDEW